MRVEILIAFEVSCDDEDSLDERVAQDAAQLAAYDFLSFCEISGVSTDTDEVEVHVDGYGKCRVRLADG